MEIARKSDGKTVDMPLSRITFALNMELTETEYLSLKNGFVPKDMEDKWLIYHDNGQFFFHRSWTGFCIYIIDCVKQSESTYVLTNVTVNQDESQYAEKDLSRIKKLLYTVICFQIKRPIGADTLRRLLRDK